jgi:hypothetical protein
MHCLFGLLGFQSREKKAKRSVKSSAPPDYHEVCFRQVSDEKGGIVVPSGLLNPELRFTAEEIEGDLRAKDVRFAAAVVELMLPRLRSGVYQEPVGWGHYSFTIEKVTSHFKLPY